VNQNRLHNFEVLCFNAVMASSEELEIGEDIIQ